MNIGIDLGNTIVNTATKKPYENSFETIRQLVTRGNEVFIVSRVNGEQRERSLAWLKEWDFFKLTYIKPENLYYCWDRRDKAIFVRGLGIELFIDDRLEVLNYIDKGVTKLLINANSPDYINSSQYPDVRLMRDWYEIEDYIFPL